MINRQIAEESENRLKEIEGEFEEKIHELKRIIQDKEYTVQELEKVKPGISKDGSIIKYREVFEFFCFEKHIFYKILNPNEQLMKLQQENTVLLNNLNKITKKSHELEEKNKQLIQTNMVSIVEFLYKNCDFIYSS